MSLLELTIVMGLSATILAGCSNIYSTAIRVYNAQHRYLTTLTDVHLALQAIMQDPYSTYYTKNTHHSKLLSLYKKKSCGYRGQEILRNVVNFNILRSQNRIAISIDIKLQNKIKQFRINRKLSNVIHSH